MLTEAANINIPIPRFDPVTSKPQSSGRPHTHVVGGGGAGRMRSSSAAPPLPVRSFRCFRRNEACSTPVWSARSSCRPGGAMGTPMGGIYSKGNTNCPSRSPRGFLCEIGRFYHKLCGLKYANTQSSRVFPPQRTEIFEKWGKKMRVKECFKKDSVLKRPKYEQLFG